MSNVTSIWQECKKNLVLGLPPKKFIKRSIIGNDSLLQIFGEAIEDRNDEEIVQIVRELTGMRRIEGHNLYTRSEVVRVFGESFNSAIINDIMSNSAESNIFKLSAAHFAPRSIRQLGNSAYYAVRLEAFEGDTGPKYAMHAMHREQVISARGVLVFMMYLATDTCANADDQRLKPCFILANAFMGIPTYSGFAVCPAGFKIPSECSSAQPAQEAEPQHTEPTQEEPKVQSEPEKPDDSKVVINMTPDLLTMMIKTAVNESVNAVWQKFMENREVLLHT